MTTPLRVLVVDDERISREATVLQLRAVGYVAESAANARDALSRLESAPWDVVLADLRMPGLDGLSLLREIKRRAPEIDVMMMTAYATVETAVEAMQDGAADYVTKPFRFPELEMRLRRLAQVRDSNHELSRLRAMLVEGDGSCGILGRSPAILQVCERASLFAASQAPVLVTGETGTGKELVARAMHELGPRRRSPFVAIACGAIPRELAESQLFGHEKGAFTGAISRRMGCFEEANGGTLLLDDVDDLPPDIQVKLLRVLQEGVLRRVGGSEDIRVDVHVVATTKVDLSVAVEQTRFRDDLFYRLRGLEIHLPPLRERGDDVLLLAQHFLRALVPGPGEPPKRLAIDAANLLRGYAWPGNVRELRRIMESAATLCRTDEITAAHLPQYLEGASRGERLYTLNLEHQVRVDLPQLVARIEQDAIRWALDRSHGQQTRAAEMLGVPRTTLQSKIGQRQ